MFTAKTAKRNRRHSRFGLLLLLCLLSALGLSGCGKYGKPDEGDCKCTVAFVKIPKEFSLLEKNVLDQFSIELTLQNITNEKKYNVTLNQENGYKQELSLNPGVYQVFSPHANQSRNTGIRLAADVESIELSRDKAETISITISNAEEFTEHWMSVQPMPEIILADKYSGRIQINRQIIDIQDILPQLNLSHEEKIQPFKKQSLTDSEKGLTVTLQNESSEPADWKDCKVTGILVTRNNVVFPEGVTLGMSPEQVCNALEGLYGEPTRFTGSLLYGLGLDDTSAIYSDPLTGNRVTIQITADGSYICGIGYDLAQFE